MYSLTPLFEVHLESLVMLFSHTKISHIEEDNPIEKPKVPIIPVFFEGSH